MSVGTARRVMPFAAALVGAAIVAGCTGPGRPHAVPTGSVSASASVGATTSTTPAPPTTGPVSALALEVGVCLGGTPDYSVTGDGDEDVVACDRPHRYEIYTEHRFTRPDYPGDDTIASEGRDACRSAFEEFVGVGFDESTLTGNMLKPTRGSWDAGDRSVLCLVADPKGLVTGTLEGADR